MVTTGENLNGGIYCRLSLASMGDTTNVDDQEKKCRRILPADVVVQPERVFKDNSRSAWRRDRKRPGWDAMLEAIRGGHVQVLAVYHGDRLVRQPRDLEDLLEAGSERGIVLVSPTGRYDLTDPDHQMMLRWMVARAKNEVDHISRRTKDGRRRHREQGIERVSGRGGRVFGFESDSVTHVPGEVTLVCEAANRVLAGESTGAILRDWAKRGVKTTTGGAWDYKPFKTMLMRPRYAGLLSDGESRAAWEPVFDGDRDKAREVWEAVRAMLSGKVLPVTPGNKARHLLSGLAACGSCGKAVVIRRHPKRGYLLYGCVNRSCAKQVHRRSLFVDEWVIGHVLAFLGDKRMSAALVSADPGLAREIAVLEARKAEVEGQLVRLVDNPHIKPELLAASIAGFDERIAELRGRIGSTARQRLVAAHAGLERDGWDDLPLHTKRALVRALFTVTIRPVSKRGPGFDPAGVAVEPVGG